MFWFGVCLDLLAWAIVGIGYSCNSWLWAIVGIGYSYNSWLFSIQCAFKKKIKKIQFIHDNKIILFNTILKVLKTFII